MRIDKMKFAHTRPDASRGDGFALCQKSRFDPEDYPKWVAAAYLAGFPGTKVAGSDKPFANDGTGILALEFPHTASSKIADYAIRVAFDENGNGMIDDTEKSLGLEVKADPWDPSSPSLGEPIVHGANGNMFTDSYDAITALTTPVAMVVAPHARSLLRIFRDGEPDANVIAGDKLPTGIGGQGMNAFLDVKKNPPGCFSEWLTHNAGAVFPDNGVVDLVEYQWDNQTSFAHVVAQSEQVKVALRSYYNNTLAGPIGAFFATLPVGAISTFPIDDTWYDITPAYTHTPDWVPKTTLTFDNPGILNWNAWDDVNGAIGRGRVLQHQARYTVKKEAAGLVVTQVRSVGLVTDLYDFSMEDSGFALQAAVLQVGFGKGTYGASRGKANIFRTHVEFDETHSGLP